MTIQPRAGKFDFAVERKLEDDDEPTGRGRAGVQSVEVAARLLDVLAAASGALTLKDLAAKAQMSASKAHRYLVSLARTGLVEQDATGRYDLGIRALSVGLAALGRIDAVRISTDELERLSDDAGATAVLAVWGEHGATVVRFQENANPVRMNVRVGSTLPVTQSAIGQVFAAFLPRDAWAAIADAEWDRFGERGEPAAFAALLESVRVRRLNRNIGVYIPGVSAFAAPLFDAQGRIAAVIGILGHEPSIAAAWDGAPARAVAGIARDVCRQLGFQDDAAPVAI
ncbi:MAG: IclR family transcriptional regulator [Alphaproteobacteria bacterium]|nr:IclR family transcriptional regulator [Alphaproteobacteria bacterium]